MSRWPSRQSRSNPYHQNGYKTEDDFSDLEELADYRAAKAFRNRQGGSSSFDHQRYNDPYGAGRSQTWPRQTANDPYGAGYNRGPPRQIAYDPYGSGRDISNHSPYGNGSSLSRVPPYDYSSQGESSRSSRPGQGFGPTGSEIAFEEKPVEHRDLKSIMSLSSSKELTNMMANTTTSR